MGAKWENRILELALANDNSGGFGDEFEVVKVVPAWKRSVN